MYLSISLSVCLSIYLSIYLYLYLHLFLHLYLFLCLYLYPYLYLYIYISNPSIITGLTDFTRVLNPANIAQSPGLRFRAAGLHRV